MADKIICPKCSAQNPKDTVFCGKCGTSLPQSTGEQEAVDPLIGSFVGDRFLVHEKLGEGGMGVVYRAEQTAIKREVALKVLHTNLNDDTMFDRFHNEASASSRLNHPNTITIFDFGRTESKSMYIAMEFVKGTSLDDDILENGAMDVGRACQIGMQICGSLQDAHDNGIIHRDLKPENVMLCERAGEKDVVKVLDFGIAKIVEDDGKDQRKALTKTGMVFGTPQYMSPEQIRGEKVDNRSDIYSLGVMLYQMVTGKLPFTSETPMGLLTKHLMDTPNPLEPQGVPAAIANVIMATLEKEADKRPSSMKELANMLGAASGITMGMAQISGTGVAAAAATTAPQPQFSGDTMPVSVEKPGGKKFPVMLVVVILVLISVGAAAFFVLNNNAPDSTDTTVSTNLPPTNPLKPPPLSPPTLPPKQPPVAQPLPPATPTPVNPGNQAASTGQAGQATGQTPPSLPTKDNAENDKPQKNKQPKKDKDKGKDKDNSSGNTPIPPIPGDLSKLAGKCYIKNAGKDNNLKMVVKALQSKKKAIKNCVKKKDDDIALALRFNINKGSDSLTKVQSFGFGPKSPCLEDILDNLKLSGKADKITSGGVAFSIKKSGGIVSHCVVGVGPQSLGALRQFIH